MKKVPGLFNNFKGLWARGSIISTPPDHFSDSQNNIFTAAGVETRDKTSSFLEFPNIVRAALYKPNPPFTGTNVPRIIFLTSAGSLYDSNFLSNPLYTNANMKDFGFVNFFGRCYISPSDGRVGLTGEFIYLYDGTGPTGFRKAAGIAPTIPITGNAGLTGHLGVGTYLISYAFETSSGFITRPAPFVAFDTFGSYLINITNLPLGPVGTAARWIIATKVVPNFGGGLYRSGGLDTPFDAAGASELLPQYLFVRIPDNTTTTYTVSFYDEQLIESADYLRTLLPELPAGVGLIDYKGRMVSYGGFADPSLVRISTIGEPESFSETSGFLITDPTDSTGVRSATEFRNILYIFKQQRAYMTQDNQEEASTWDVVNFEKSIGTEQYGIAAVLDAKGSSSEGFLLGSRGGIVFFNGVFSDPEISYKIRDLWLRINPTYFYKVQLAHDPINRRIYALVPLDSATTCSHLIYGDYRNGLDPVNIKWDLWTFDQAPVSILIYNKFAENVPSLVTQLVNAQRIVNLDIGQKGNDIDTPIHSYFQFAPTSFGGVSQFTNVIIRGIGPSRLAIRGYKMDGVDSNSNTFTDLPELSIPNANPGREYNKKMNLVSEQCILKISQEVPDLAYAIEQVQLVGAMLWKERPM